MQKNQSLPFLFILDTSGSMYGEKIYALNLAVSNLISGFKNVSLATEPEIAIITYGGEPKLYLPFTPVSKIAFKGLEARGPSMLTEALVLAGQLLTKKTALLLVSDGIPDDGGFVKALNNIALKPECYCIGIGYDADYDMLERFTKNKEHVFKASDANDIAEFMIKSLLGGTP